jgi:ribonuclease VapC
MVIDTSAIVAILFDEPDHRRYAEAIAAAPVRLVSAVTHVELSFVAEGRKGEAGRARLDRFFALTGTEIVSKGRHAAALNIGDCFSYALATATNHPLLFKGNNFN